MVISLNIKYNLCKFNIGIGINSYLINHTNDSKIPTNEPSIKPIQPHKRTSNKSPLQLLGNRAAITKIKIKHCKKLFKIGLKPIVTIKNKI